MDLQLETAEPKDLSGVAPSGASSVGLANALLPQQVAQSCPTCGTAGDLGVIDTGVKMSPFIYAIGQIQVRIPSLGLEKELAQAIGRGGTNGQTDRQALQTLLIERANRYLARQVCWVFTIEGLDTYILYPRDPLDLDSLVQAMRPNPRATDIDVIVGVRGPIAPPTTCNGLQVPIVLVDQIYSFDADTLVKQIPRPSTVEENAFGSAAEELFTRVIQLADNAGATDEHRALNYLAMRYPAIYAQTAEAFGRNFALTGVEVRGSRLSGVRKIVDVIFTYRNRNTDVLDMYFARVDVTEEFPFLVTQLSPYYDR